MFEGLKNHIIKLLGGYTAEEFLHHCMIAPGDSADKRIQDYVRIIGWQRQIIDALSEKSELSCGTSMSEEEHHVD